MEIKRTILEETVRHNPDPDAYEGWLLERCLTQDRPSGVVLLGFPAGVRLDHEAKSAAETLANIAALAEVVDRCLQLFGGYGYMDEYPISRMYRDARVQRIYGGTNEIMKEVITRAMGLGAK